MGRLERSRPGVARADRRRKWFLRLAAATLISGVAACLLVVVTPSLPVVRPSLAAARSGPDRGLTKATALKARAGRTYTVTLANNKSPRWLFVRDPYDPSAGCLGRCPVREEGEDASALVGATVQSRGGSCVAHVLVQGPTLNQDTGNMVERRLARGLVTSGTTFTTLVVPTWFGRVYLGLSPDSSLRCHNARYAVRLTVQRAMATAGGFATRSASAAQYGDNSSKLRIAQAVCAQKSDALDRTINRLNQQIVAARRHRGAAGKIAKLKAAINTAVRRFNAACPQK